MESSEAWTEYRSTALVSVKKYTSTANSYDVFHDVIMVVEFAVGHLPVHHLRMSVIQLASSSLFPDSQVGICR